MIILDTDHLTILQQPSSAALARLQGRMDARAAEGLAATIISVEEQIKGWFALIGRAKSAAGQVAPYDRLASTLEFYAGRTLLRFDARAASTFDDLRKRRIRIGTPDLKITSIALVHGATVLSVNLRDFRQVPGLTVEDWLH